MYIYFIRHGQTKGNLEKRYVGSTDESLTKEGREILCYNREKIKLYEQNKVEKVYCSPKKRCIETAQMIYSNQTRIIVEELTECNFGVFEYKNYKELEGNDYYQRWIESGGILGFPEGEDRQTFQKRSLSGFQKIIKQSISEKNKTIAIVAHGGTIMSILDLLAVPKRDFYEWQVKNGCGYLLEIEEEEWQRGQQQITVLKEILIST